MRYLDKDSKEFIQGYHAAIRDVMALATDMSHEAQREHATARSWLYFWPSKAHNIALGKSRAAAQIGRDLMHMANAALKELSKRIS